MLDSVKTEWTEEMDRVLIEAADRVASDYRGYASAWAGAQILVSERTNEHRTREQCMRRFQAIVRESEVAYAAARVSISVRNSVRRARLAKDGD